MTTTTAGLRSRLHFLSNLAEEDHGYGHIHPYAIIHLPTKQGREVNNGPLLSI